MANTRDSTTKPTTSRKSSDEKTHNGSEYYVNVGHNNGTLTVGNNNTITTFNVYSYLKIESLRDNNKKKSHRKIKKKERQEKVKLNRGEDLKNPEPTAKGKKSEKNSPRKERIRAEGHSSEKSNADEELKPNEQDFVTTSEDEGPPELTSSDLATDSCNAGKTTTIRYRSKNHNRPSIKKQFTDVVSENESEFNNSKSGDSFSPYKVALRQVICFAACVMFCLYFEVLSSLPFLFWSIFVANNLLACFSCIKLAFKMIDCQEDKLPHVNIHRSFLAIARLQIDFYIKEEGILQRLFALLLCVSLAFVSSQIFGCAKCLFIQTIVVTIVSTFPYILFKNNVFLPIVLLEHCRIFKIGIESSKNILC